MIKDKLIKAYTENKFLDASRKRLPLINFTDKLIQFTNLPILSDNYYNYKQIILQLYPYGKHQSIELAVRFNDLDFLNKLQNLARSETINIEEIEDDLLNNYPKSKDTCLKFALSFQKFDFIDQLVETALKDQDYDLINQLVLESF